MTPQPGSFVVGEYLSHGPALRADGTPVSPNKCELRLLVHDEAVRIGYWSTSTDKASGEVSPTPFARKIAALGAARGDLLLVRAVAGVWSGRLTWDGRDVEVVTDEVPAEVPSAWAAPATAEF